MSDETKKYLGETGQIELKGEHPAFVMHNRVVDLERALYLMLANLMGNEEGLLRTLTNEEYAELQALYKAWSPKP